MPISRQVRRYEERKQEKEDHKLARKLELSDFTYEADDANLTFSAMGPQLVDFTRVIGLPGFLREHLSIAKRKSPYPPDKLSLLLVIQNILGYNRIVNDRPCRAML